MSNPSEAPEPRDDETPPGEGSTGNTEKLALRIFERFNHLRDERQAQLAPPVPIAADGLRSSHIPLGFELAASWAWRFLVIVAALFVLFRATSYLGVVVVPLVVALLLSALLMPLVNLLQRARIPRGLSAFGVVLLLFLVVGLLLTFAGTQVANGANDLADQVVKGLGDIRTWLRTGPLHASDSQINDWIASIQKSITDWVSGNPLGSVSKASSIALDVLASLFIVIFSLYFFLAEGTRIWAWVVRLTPRAARGRVHSSGQVAWTSLTQFVRATAIVALVDAVGVMIVAAVLGVPLVMAIGVLVFLGAFIPLVGGTLAGTVAVLIAFVDQGFVTALIMLAGVVAVMQLEGHVMQPFLMGRWVRVHPLGVIVAIAIGILVAGIAGALVAVPLAAVLNAVGLHLAALADGGGEAPPEAAGDVPPA